MENIYTIIENITQSLHLTKKLLFFETSFCFLPFLQTYRDKAKADASTRAKEVHQASEGGVPCPLYISHPVSQKQKKVFRTDQATFLLGETPKGVRRYVISQEIQLLSKTNTLFSC